MSNEEKTTDELEQEAHQRLSGSAPQPAEPAPGGDKEPQGNAPAEKPEAEMTVAEREKAVRDRIRAAAREDSAQEADSTAHTAAEVAKTKKRPKNKLLMGIGLFAVAAAIVGMVGFNLWQKTRNTDTPPPPASADKSDGVSNQRTGLGKKVDPLRPETKPLNDTDTASGGEAKGGGETAAASGPITPPEFKRYLSLETAEETQGNGDNGRSRTQEKAEADAPAAEKSSASGKGGEAAPTPQTLNTVTRIPYNPDLYVPENTPIPCALDYRFVSDLKGKSRCTITQDIYSASGNTKLIDKGTSAFLAYGALTLKHGQGRAFIMVTKLRTRQAPFLDIPLMDTQAAGELGEAGASGWIDEHWIDRFGGALMLGMIPDITAAASNQAGKKDRNTDYTENSRQSLAEIAKTAFENSVNIPPTLYKNQGEIITLITGQDIDFSNVYQLKLNRRQGL